MLGIVISICLVLIVLLIGLQGSAPRPAILGAVALVLLVLAVFFWTMSRLRTELTDTDTTASKQANQKLRESEDRHRTLLGATFEATVIHTDEGVILEVNHAFETMFGIPGMLATGLTILAFLVEGTRELFSFPTQSRFDVILGYDFKIRARYTLGVQLNVHNINNHYKVIILPNAVSGWAGPNGAVFSGEPRTWELSTTIGF